MFRRIYGKFIMGPLYGIGAGFYNGGKRGLALGAVGGVAALGFGFGLSVIGLAAIGAMATNLAVEQACLFVRNKSKIEKVRANKAILKDKFNQRLYIWGQKPDDQFESDILLDHKKEKKRVKIEQGSLVTSIIYGFNMANKYAKENIYGKREETKVKQLDGLGDSYISSIKPLTYYK